MEAAAVTQLARALAALTEQEFPASRGLESRLDAYLQLEELLRLEDSEASVIALQAHVSSLLSEVRFDLQHKALGDVLHAVLRCLSYLMHHRSLSATFSDAHVAFFLAELVRLLFSTQDPSTYKLCVWCLTEQNFAAERHTLLPRMVEGLVQAVVNPFKSRAIEMQALKGLHLLLVKYPEQLGADGAVLSIFVRPIASRLASSEASTRTQARFVLEEARKHLPKWSKETLEMVQDCAEKYLLPVMKMHVERNRLREAVYLWKLTLALLKSRFSKDLGMLNKVLYVPEKCMEDADAAIRLMAMQAWGDVVCVFHACENWLFNKAVASLLAWPINVCLQQEVLLIVRDAAFGSWQQIVSVAVQDFNAHCKTQQQAVEAGHQHNVPDWKCWFGELVMTPLLTLMKKRMHAKDGASTVELEQFIDFATQLWQTEERESDTNKNSPFRSEGSSSTTMGGSSVDGSVGAKQPVRAPRTASKSEELQLVGDHTCGSVHITSELIGVAFVLEDVFGAVQNLIKISDECRSERSKWRANDLVMNTWKGVCQRIHSDSKRDGATSTFGLRLVRMAIDFSLGILTSRSASAEMAAISAPTGQAGENVEGQAAGVVVASIGFGLEWQLRLLAPLVSDVVSPRDLQAVLLHPKSKLFDHIAQRMEYLKDMYVQCANVLEKWNSSETNELHVDFSAKESALPFLVMNLLFEYAVFVDDINYDGADGRQSVLMYLDIVVKKLMESVKVSAPQQARGLDAVVRFGEESIRAAHEIVAYDYAATGKKSMLDELVNISKNFSEHTYESQQNASLLLDLHQSRGNTGVVISATASTASFATSSDVCDAEDKGTLVVQESEYVSASLDTGTSSPCLLSGELSTIPSASPVEPSPASSMDTEPKAQSKSQRSADQSALSTEGKADAKPASTSPQKIGTSDGKGAKSPEVTATGPPAGSQSAPPKLFAGRTQRPNLSTSLCIYPDLVGCAEGITSLCRHFPLGLRLFFSFYKVKTIGDLSALPVEKVRTFGLKEPVSTVRRALEEYNGGKDRMKSLTGNPFRQRRGSATTSPAIPAPSPHKPSKRPFHLESGGNAPLSLERHDHKRTKRSLVLDVEDGDEEESEGTRRKPKLADRVTFCLETGETGETRITRPGEDSQDQLKPSDKVEEKEKVHEKVDTFTLKLLQHLRRSTYYMDKLVAEEEGLQSEVASLQTSIANVGGVITNYQEAHDLVSRLASQLQIAAETSSKRCRTLLDKRG
ncbi:hypothetical protein PHYPSEUDO_005984 [Phytophthora pseudosyringae]|uniref:Telomere-associated protein Rif1 N-terminal domain-containing protein n=1 Tax=Phytophthora pseudosyringae TaxID=221518 RepID=A0A8T1VK56_9STRA|nr:hypothetical protein PHYPSEUDO_005984 [Phytophthora pseudosyringae]